MTWKTGDTVTVPVQLLTAFGKALTYASLAAFQADGWALEFTQLGAAISVTVSSLVPDPSKTSNPSTFDGTHLVTITLPQPGATLCKALTSNRLYQSGYSLFMVNGLADMDSLSASIAAGIGTPVAGGTVVTVNDINVVEGDSLSVVYAIAASALRLFDAALGSFQYSTLADIGGQAWTIAAQARYVTENGELPTQAVAFSFTAVIYDKPNRGIAIGWSTPPAGAVIDDLLPSAPTVTVSGGAITGTTGGLGGHFYGTNVPTVALTGGGGTGGVITPVITNGAVTGYTVTSAGSGYGSAPTATLSVKSDGAVSSRKFAFDAQLQPPAGSTYAGQKITVITGFINLLRQQTTTP